MLLLKVYKHSALPGWNSNLPFLKKNGGTDPTRAAQQRTAMYIKVLCFVNIVAYLSDFTMLKYRLTEINPIVWREIKPVQMSEIQNREIGKISHQTTTDRGTELQPKNA